MEKLYIREDISDWRDETFQDETIIEQEDDIFAALEQGISTPKIARAALVSRELGKAPADLIRSNKVLLNVGAMADVIAIAHKPKVKVQTKNGEYDAPAFVGKVATRQLEEEQVEGEPEIEETETEPDDSGPSFVRLGDDLAGRRAQDYLDRIVPGHIWNRLLIIHSAGGDVRQAALEVKGKIDEMVGRIV